MRKFVFLLLMGLICLNFVTSETYEDIKTWDKEIEYIQEDEHIIVEKDNFFFDTEIAEYWLLENGCFEDREMTTEGFQYCNALVNITFHKEGKPFEELNFYKKINENLVNGKVRWYQILVYTKGKNKTSWEWGCYNSYFNNEINETIKENCSIREVITPLPNWSIYDNSLFEEGENVLIKLIAEKSPHHTLDWVFLVFGDLPLDVWALWLSDGGSANNSVILNSPEDEEIFISPEVEFNCSVFNSEVSIESVYLEFFDYNNESWEIVDNVSGMGNDILLDENCDTSPIGVTFEQNENQVIYHNNKILIDSLSAYNTGGAYSVENFTGDIKVSFILEGYVDRMPAEWGGAFGGVGIQESKSGVFSSKFVVIQNRTGNLGVYSIPWGTENFTLPLKLSVDYLISQNKIKIYIDDVFIEEHNKTDLPTGEYYIALMTRDGGFYFDDIVVEKLGEDEETFVFTQNITQNELWRCSACDIDEDCGNSIENRSVYLDFPNITLLSPIGQTYNKDITANFNITALGEIDYCFLNVTRGESLEVGNKEIINNSVDFNVSGYADYNLNVGCNTTTGISKSESFPLSVNAEVIVVSSGGGGGSGSLNIFDLLNDEEEEEIEEDICEVYVRSVNNNYQNLRDDFNNENLKEFGVSLIDYIFCKSAAQIVPFPE